MECRWNVNNYEGSCEIRPGENHILFPIKPGTPLFRAEAAIDIPASEKMFFNGYQTWTHSPEFEPHHKIRGLHGLTKLITKPLGLYHYSDYHFVDYPNRKGILHGFSYCYFRDGNRYRLLASLDERPGYTIFTFLSEKDTLMLKRDCVGVKAGSPEFHLFDLFYAEGSEQEVFDQWFDALGIHNKAPKIKGYSSWYNHYLKISEASIRDDLTGARKIFDPGDLFQIDDGWEPFVGDWESPDPRKFPYGLQPIVRDIHDAGFRAGLWLAPFACVKRSKICREHPDWLLSYQGKPWKNGPNWGGFYSLDIDNPWVRNYLKEVFRRVLDEWGFDLVKLDFLFAAAPFPTGDHGYGNDGPFPESRAARMIRAMEFLRECCGKKLILGCGVPVMPAFGLVDYCRIGSDVGLDWDDLPPMRMLHRERVSTNHSINNTIFRRQLNGRAFGSDPDVFFLRDHNIRLSAQEKNYQAVLDALFGSVWLTSDNLNAYDAARIAQYRKLARLQHAENIRIDPDLLTITYTLDGDDHFLHHPHIFS